MKLKSGFITHMVGQNQMMVDVSGKLSGVIRSNETAAEIIDMLKTETTEAEIVSKMLEKYDAAEETMIAAVRKVTDKLRSLDAIDE